MRVVYIASPYTKGDVAENVANQIAVSHQLLDLGFAPIAPLLSHYLHIYRQRPYADWLNMCLSLVPKADVLLRLPGESEGADKEVILAQIRNIPVVYHLHELHSLFS